MSNGIGDIEQLAYFDIAVHDKQAWFCNYMYPVICKLDLLSYKISVEAFIQNHGTKYTDLYGPIAYYKGNLIIAPRNACQILIYSISQKKFREIPISMDVMEEKQRYKLFMDIVIIGNEAYLLPCRYPALIKLEIEALQVTYYNSWYQELKKYLCEPNRFIFGRAAIRDEHECLLPVWQDNLLVQVDLKTGKYAIHRVFDSHTQFSAIAFDGENYWVAPRNKNMLLKWEQKNRVVVYDGFPVGFEMSGETRFVSLECIGEEIIAVPKYGNGNMIIALNRNTGKFRRVGDILTSPIKRIKKGRLGQGIILCCKKIDERTMIIFSDFDGKTLIIKSESGERSQFETIFEEESQNIYVQKLIFSTCRKISRENQEVSLQEYLKHFSLYEQNTNGQNSYTLIGKRIFKEINTLLST